MRITVVASLVVLAGLSKAGAQTTSRAPAGSVHTPQSFRRIAQVYDPDTQEGIADAQVVDRITGNSVKTSATGHFVLVPEFVKSTGALLEIKKIGYEPVGPILVDPNSDTALLVPMVKRGTELPAVVTRSAYIMRVSPAMQGFEQRRNDHSIKGVFVTPEEMRAKWNGIEIAELLAMNGIPRRGRPAAARGRNCHVEYLINGTPSSALPPGMRLADAIEAAEIYLDPLMMPAEFENYRKSDICGLVVLHIVGS